MGSSRFTSRNGFSMIDCMISIAILAVGVMSTLTFISTLKSTRDASSDMVRANTLCRTLVDRIQGATWSRLATTALPWSQARFDSTGFTPALSPLDQPLTEADLLSLQVIQQSPSLPDLKIYVEYYRAIGLLDSAGARISGKEGLLEDSSVVSAATSTAIFKDNAKLNLYRIRPDPNGKGLDDTTLLGVDDPVVIRLILKWDTSRRLEFITGRKR